MRIGIVPTLDPSSGGLHQYSLTVLEALAVLSKQMKNHEFIVFANPNDEPYLRSLGGTLRRVPLRPPPLTFKERVIDLIRARMGDCLARRMLGELLRRAWRLRRTILIRDPERIRRRVEFAHWFGLHEVDWVFYTAPSELSFEVGLPYVMPVHDLQHRLQPEFPEVSANGEWEEREYTYRNAIRYATLILADSEVGKEDIIRFYGPYGAAPDRIKVLPHSPPSYLSLDAPKRLRVRQAYHLPERYVFYPAQFWPHKNHARIIEALELLKREYNAEIHVVFCGTHSGEIRERTFREVTALAHRLRLSDQVHYLGRVPDEAMSGLYAGAFALVMPTFFGPTNIPPMEAWALGCPVLCSDIRGIREQIGNAGLLVSPRSTEAIAEGIYRLWTDKHLRDQLAVRGRRRLARYTPEDFRRRLADIVCEANELVRGLNR